MKVISAGEEKQLMRLLDNMRGSDDSLTFLTPSCRVLTVSEDQFIVISPNLMLRRNNLPHTIFDLKGNWGWRNRNANKSETVKKDRNFKDFFPNGLRLTSHLNLESGTTVYDGDENRESDITSQLRKDTQRLSDLGLMDYSILIDVIKLDGLTDDETSALVEANHDKPLVWAVAGDGGDAPQYLMS